MKGLNYKLFGVDNLEPLYKRMIRQQIMMELMKDEPNYELTKKWYKMIETDKKYKVNVNTGRKSAPKGKNSDRYRHDFISFDEYIKLKLNNYKDIELTKIYKCSNGTLQARKMEWGIHKVNKELQLESYMILRDKGLSDEEISKVVTYSMKMLKEKLKKWKIE